MKVQRKCAMPAPVFELHDDFQECDEESGPESIIHEEVMNVFDSAFVATLKI